MAEHPANMGRRIMNQIDDARVAGGYAAWIDARASMCDKRIYEGTWQGIPMEFIDPSNGHVIATDDICRACWKSIEGVVTCTQTVRCVHWHPDCHERTDLSRLCDGPHVDRIDPTYDWHHNCPVPHYHG